MVGMQLSGIFVMLQQSCQPRLVSRQCHLGCIWHLINMIHLEWHCLGGKHVLVETALGQVSMTAS